MCALAAAEGFVSCRFLRNCRSRCMQRTVLMLWFCIALQRRALRYVMLYRQLRNHIAEWRASSVADIKACCHWKQSNQFYCFRHLCGLLNEFSSRYVCSVCALCAHVLYNTTRAQTARKSHKKNFNLLRDTECLRHIQEINARKGFYFLLLHQAATGVACVVQCFLPYKSPVS